MKQILAVALLAPTLLIVGPVAAVLGTPCEYEDSVNCHWVADLQGNGKGQSFAAFRLTDGSEPLIIYLPW